MNAYNATVGLTGAVSVSSTLGVTGATTLSSTLGVTGTSTLAAVNASGTVTLTAAAPTLNVGSSAVSTSDCAIQIGHQRNGSGNAYVDLVASNADTPDYSDYGDRLIRYGGPNGIGEIIHRGTGEYRLRLADATAELQIWTNGTKRMTVGSAGEVAIGTTPQTGWELYVNGDVGVVNGVLNGAIRLVPGTVPTSSTDSTGSQWDVRANATDLFIRVATSGNYWKKIPMQTF
jgi:hypothetical protein